MDVTGAQEILLLFHIANPISLIERRKKEERKKKGRKKKEARKTL